MNSIKRLLVMGFSPAALLLSGCVLELDDGSSSAPIVNVSGTLTYAGWVQGDYYAELYTDGTPIGQTGWLVQLRIGVMATSTDYVLPLNGNQGAVYVFGFNDDDGDTSPSGLNDGTACSVVFNLGSADVPNVDLTLAGGGTFPGCPL